MKDTLEEELKRVRILLTAIIVLLALQFVPSQMIKDLFGIGFFAVGCIYAVLLMMESVLKAKISTDRDSELTDGINHPHPKENV